MGDGVRLHDDNTLIVYPACGVVNEDATELVAEEQEKIAHLHGDLHGKRSRIAMLAGDSEFKAIHSPYYQKAIRVLARWRDACAPRARDLHGKRIVHCVARSKKYSEDDLNLSVDGYARFPFVVAYKRSHVGSMSEWCADAEFIFRSPKNVEQGMRLAEQDSTQIPHALLEQVSWRRVRELNRKAIISYLEGRFGAPFQDGHFLYSPCPRCDRSEGMSSPLRITVGEASWIAECSRCGLTEQQLLAMVSRGPRRQQNGVAVQLELVGA